MRNLKWLVVVVALGVVAATATVALSAPPGDGYARNTAIEASLGNTSFDSTDAPKSLNRLGCGADVNEHVVWFVWVATETATITADTDNSSVFDTVLAVYEHGKKIACDDDGGSGNWSLVTFDAQEGKPYYFAVATYDTAPGGLIQLNLND